MNKPVDPVGQLLCQPWAVVRRGAQGGLVEVRVEAGDASNPAVICSVGVLPSDGDVDPLVLGLARALAGLPRLLRAAEDTLPALGRLLAADDGARPVFNALYDAVQGVRGGPAAG